MLNLKSTTPEITIFSLGPATLGRSTVPIELLRFKNVIMFYESSTGLTPEFNDPAWSYIIPTEIHVD